MLPLGCKSLAEHEIEVLYRAWEGQLFIQNQRVCDIVLRSSFQASIPAQLPAKLEFKYIVHVSELRKKLPEAAFKKNSYSNDEVCCQQLSFRLYQVEILDESELKDQLIGSMKEKNLALVKYLNDRGILLFLTSSALAKEKDAEANDLGSLQALFLFPSPGPRHLTATDWKGEEGKSESPQELPLILPLLRRALAGAAKNPNPKQSPSSALVKLHIQEFADLDPCSALNCDNTAGPPLTSKLSPETPKGAPVDDTCSPSSFSNLAFYLSDPGSYTLEMASATAACLKGRSQLSDGCAGLSGPEQAAGTGKGPFDGHGPRRDAASKSSPSGERSLQWMKRKSSRILGASSKKKWSPLKMYCILESSKKKTKEKRKKKKKKKKKLPKEVMVLNIPFVKDPGSPADPKRPTLKLKNILNPLRRKRGAEVLSAEFIQGPRSVSLEGAPESSAGPATEEKKPRLNMAVKVKNGDKTDTKEPTPRKNIHDVSSEKQRTEAASTEKDMVTLDAHRMPSRGEECDSHALNLLADLALSSCNSPLDGNNRRDFVRFRPSWEHRLPRGKFLHKSSDHEYHRATMKRKSAFLPGQPPRSPLWPAKDKDGPLNAKDRSGMNPVKKKKARINLAKTSLALPNETGDLSDSSAIISLEHSYASPISETPPKATPPSPNSNGVKQDKPGPLVGKVLPFQHQQNWCRPDKPVTNHLSPARSTILANRLKEEFATSRQVTSCDKTVQVTLQWEAKYVFDLDSKYTNDSLEKTIIRAVHGPWDGSLSDDLEEMKLILHMWVALFYGKPAPTLTVRKVVEHRNPAKYVSLNSLVEPLEFLGDGGEPYVLEERLAASLPKTVQRPAEGGEDGSVSPPKKLLPGSELSATNSLEDESPLTELEATKDLPEKEGPSPPPKSIDEAVEAEPKEQTSLHPVLPVETPPGADERGNPPISQTKTDRNQETMLVETPQNEASVPSGPPGGTRNQEPDASTKVAVAVPKRGSDIGSSSSEEVKKDNLPVGGPNPGTLKGEGLKADVESREPSNPGNGVGNQPRLRTEEGDGESVDLGSVDLWLSKSNEDDMEVRDMDLVSEDEEDPLQSGETGREETDGMIDDKSSEQGPLPSRASSPDASPGHPTEFPSVQEAEVRLSSSSVPQQKISGHPVTVDEKMVGSTTSSVSPSQMGLMDTVPQQKISGHPVTVDEKMVGSTSSSVSPSQMGLMDTVSQQKISSNPVTVDEKMVGSTSSSLSPSQMRLMDTVPQQKISGHPVTVDEKMVGSATDPTSPKQTDEVENSCDEAILADSASTEASRDFPNARTTPEGALQSPQESAESPRVSNQVDMVDLPSVSQEDSGIHSPCLPSWQPSPVHQGASDEEPPRIPEDRPDNHLYPFFQNPMGLIEDISQDSTDFTDSAVQLCEPNDSLCVNLCVPNSVSTRQESVENQDRSVAFAQYLPLAKETVLVESPEGDHPASPVHQEISDEAATLQDDSGAQLDLLEGSSIPQQKDCQVSQHHPTDDVLGPVNEQLAEFDSVTQEEPKINQGEKIRVDSQPATEYPSLESPAAESEMSFKSETCLDQENLGDSSAREEEEAVPDDGIEKPTANTTAVAEEVQVLMNELVDTVCSRVAQSEEMRAPKSFGWIDSALLECVTPAVSDDEGCPTGQQSHADVKWAEGRLEESSSFDDQEEDLQARVEGRGESCSPLNENTTSDPGDVSEKGNDATSAATGIFSSGGTSQAELDTTSPKSKCSWLETIESPDDYSANVDDYDVSTLEKVGQTEASPEEPICNREDCSRGENVGNSSFVQAKCQEDSLAEEPGSLVDRDSNEVPEDREEEAKEEAKGCVGKLEDPLRDERTEMSISSSGTDTDSEDESRMVDGGQDPCVDWYTTRTFESWYQPRLRASPSVESELTPSSVPGNETCKDGDWVSSEASQKTSDAGSMKRNVPLGLKKGCLWSGDMDRKPQPFKDYINFSVTKKHKEKSRTFHSFSKEHHPFSRDLRSINSWSKNWGLLNDPIQNILDVESLRFHCRIQALLKRSQRSTSRVLPSKKVPSQGIAEGLSPGTVSEGTIARFPTRSKSPLLVTVVNPNPRTRCRNDDIYDQFPASLHPSAPAIASRSRGGLGPKYPFPSSHLQKLTHPTRNSFSRDISSVLEEFAEFSRVMTLESSRTRTLDRDPTATSEKASKIQYPPRPPTPLVYEDLLTELRNALHFQLTNVAHEACRKPFSFYLMETEDDPFFRRVKNLLRKGGHSEVDLLHFCKGSGVETENLLVIVRNEDICSHIHKVPSLLRLKRCPSVTFAGVDSPEDPLDHTYQELFHSGGFVVSDDNVLEGMSVGELKDVIKTLEKLNSHGRWKWLLHYRESKKLKKDARGDLAAYAKESVLKSCQVANMTEVLHYHKCDSRSCTRFERFNCLLNLQIQHITKRFGVFLTESASASREALEDKGIFSLNITDFITTAQGMVAPSGRGFW